MFFNVQNFVGKTEFQFSKTENLNCRQIFNRTHFSFFCEKRKKIRTKPLFTFLIFGVKCFLSSALCSKTFAPSICRHLHIYLNNSSFFGSIQIRKRHSKRSLANTRSKCCAAIGDYNSER